MSGCIGKNFVNPKVGGNPVCLFTSLLLRTSMVRSLLRSSVIVILHDDNRKARRRQLALGELQYPLHKLDPCTDNPRRFTPPNVKDAESGPLVL